VHILLIPSEPFVPHYLPLAGIFQQHQARALTRAGYQIGVISPCLRNPGEIKKKISGWPYGFENDTSDQFAIFRYYGWFLVPHFQAIKIRQWVAVGAKLFQQYILNYGKPDIIHAHNALYAGILARYINKRWAIPYVITEHSSAYATGKIDYSLIRQVREVYEKAVERMVVSPSLSLDVHRYLGDEDLKFKWIPNVLEDLFEERQDIKHEHPKTYFTFLNIGALVELKGQVELLHAFSMSFRGQPGIYLRLGGEGPLRKTLQKLANELGIEQQVVFMGHLERKDVLREMLSCDVYVHPSHYETFGVAIIEALACGRPVIATDCGGPRYIISNTNGVLIPPKNSSELSQALTHFMESYKKYNPDKIREDTIQQFGERTFVKKMGEIYSAWIK
jgi:L-malate glycosyltransferase